MSRVAFLSIILLFLNIQLSVANNRSDSMRVYKSLDSQYLKHQENDIAECLRLGQRMMNIAQWLADDTLIMDVMTHYAECYGILGKIDLATEENYKILKIANRTNRLSYQANALYRLAMIEQSLGDFKKSNEFLNQAKAKFIQARLFTDTITTNFELGFNCIAARDYDWGIAIVEQNVAAAKKLNDSINVVLGFDNLSNICFEKGDLQRSLNYLLKVLQYPAGLKSNFRKAGYYEHLTELYVALQQWKNAARYLDSSFKYTRIINSIDWLNECYKMQAAVAEGTGNYKLAMEIRKMQLDIKDTLFQKEVENKIAATSTLYELDKKQAHIALLEKDNELHRERLKQREFQRNAAIGIGVLLVLLIAASFLAWLQRRTRHLQVAFSRSLIQSQEAERQRISRELHDSVGQNILFIRNQLLNTGRAAHLGNVMETIDATMNEVRSLSKDLYPNQLEKYGLAAAVEALCEKIAAATGIFASSDIQEIEAALGKDAVINCYRIIQESLNNIIKHAEATAVRITGTKQGANLVLCIMDNGKGFDTDTLEKKSQSSFGMLNMEERAKMMGGKMAVESDKNGTRITITLPE